MAALVGAQLILSCSSWHALALDDGGEGGNAIEPPPPSPVVAAAAKVASLPSAPQSPSGVPNPATPRATRYPHGLLHSPMTASIVRRLSSVVFSSANHKDVFAKIGDSNTVNQGFAHCFAANDLTLPTYPSLEPTLAFFRGRLVDSVHTSFDRTSLAAKVGWTSTKAVEGSNFFNSPIEQEVAAIRPGFAVVLLGTNDTLAYRVNSFARDLLKSVDLLLSLGVVPLLNTVPPRADSVEAAALVPEMNAIVYAIAQARQVPLMDLHATVASLPELGLSTDGVHLESHWFNGQQCAFMYPSLREGMTQRNLLTLQALDRVRRIILLAAPPDPEPEGLIGAGTWHDPLVVDALPFVDDRATRSTRSTRFDSNVDSYPCNDREERGREVVYTVSLAAAAKLRARVFGDDGVDVDLHWLDSSGRKRCAPRGSQMLDIDAPNGTYRLVVDTFYNGNNGGKPKEGPFRLTLVRLDGPSAGRAQ
ncbi:MAG: hypothetical protein NVS3B20_05860 [Polyangiales bacterium]